MIAPAARSRVTATQSCAGTKSRRATEPLVAGAPVIQMWSLTDTGTPRSGADSPRATRASAARAAAIASSWSTTVNALIVGCASRIAARAELVTACAVCRPARMAAAVAYASISVMGLGQRLELGRLALRDSCLGRDVDVPGEQPVEDAGHRQADEERDVGAVQRARHEAGVLAGAQE